MRTVLFLWLSTLPLLAQFPFSGTSWYVTPASSGGPVSPVYFNSGTNAGTTGTLVGVTNASAHATPNVFILAVTGYDLSSHAVAEVTNSLGVVGTGIQTNFWTADNLGIGQYYYWTNTAMTYAMVRFASAPATWRLSLQQFYNTRTYLPIGNIATNKVTNANPTNTVTTDSFSALVSFSVENDVGGTPAPTWANNTGVEIGRSVTAGDYGMSAAYTNCTQTSTKANCSWSSSPNPVSLFSLQLKGTGD